MSEYRRKQLLRRLGLVFMGTFVWFPLVSIPLQFFDAVGTTLAPTNEMSAGTWWTYSVFSRWDVRYFGNGCHIKPLLVVAGFVVAFRWIALYVLTPIMPLLVVLWSIEVWPFSPAANMARRVAGIYPGLVLAGIPPAILFRIGWEVGGLETSVKGLFSLFIGLTLIPAAIIAMVMTVYWSSPAIRTIAQKGASTTNPAAAKAGAAKAKHTSGKAVRGARNVHRGYAENQVGAVTKSGQTTLESGDSKAYKLGSSARSTKDHAGRYNNLREVEDRTDAR